MGGVAARWGAGGEGASRGGLTSGAAVGDEGAAGELMGEASEVGMRRIDVSMAGAGTDEASSGDTAGTSTAFSPALSLSRKHFEHISMHAGFLQRGGERSTRFERWHPRDPGGVRQPRARVVPEDEDRSEASVTEVRVKHGAPRRAAPERSGGEGQRAGLPRRAMTGGGKRTRRVLAIRKKHHVWHSVYAR